MVNLKSPSGMRSGMADKVRKHLWIQGKVQGVWFREATKQEAERIGGVEGWVKNLVDGRVEAVVQGSPGAVDRLVEFCRQGPEAARVEHLEVVEEPVEDGERGFRVER